MTGSERVSRLVGDGFTLYNTYGCSESAAVVTTYQIGEAMENTPIGKPLGELQFFLLDEDGGKFRRAKRANCASGELLRMAI